MRTGIPGVAPPRPSPAPSRPPASGRPRRRRRYPRLRGQRPLGRGERGGRGRRADIRRRGCGQGVQRRDRHRVHDVPQHARHATGHAARELVPAAGHADPTARVHGRHAVVDAVVAPRTGAAGLAAQLRVLRPYAAATEPPQRQQQRSAPPTPPSARCRVGRAPGAAPTRARHTAELQHVQGEVQDARRVAHHILRPRVDQHAHAAAASGPAAASAPPAAPPAAQRVQRQRHVAVELARRRWRRELARRRRRVLRRPDQRRAAAAAARARPQQTAAGHIQGGDSPAQAEATHAQEPRLRAELPHQAHEPAHRAGERQPAAAGRAAEDQVGAVTRHAGTGHVQATVVHAGGGPRVHEGGREHGRGCRLVRVHGRRAGGRQQLQLARHGLPVTDEEVVRVCTVDIQVSANVRQQL